MSLASLSMFSGSKSQSVVSTGQKSTLATTVDEKSSQNNTLNIGSNLFSRDYGISNYAEQIFFKEEEINHTLRISLILLFFLLAGAIYHLYINYRVNRKN